MRFMIPDTYSLKSTQNLHCAVDVIHPPTAKPRTVRLLLVSKERDRLLDTPVALVIAIVSEHFEYPTSNVNGSRIEHRIMISEGNVLKNHLVVVFVKRRPTAVLALHCENPVHRPLCHLVLIAFPRILDSR